VWETSLDQSFIEYLSRVPPRTFSSDWTAVIKTHFLGAKALFGKWEVADIGLLIMYSIAGVLKRTKLALLQSKRLYANEIPYGEDELENYLRGFARLYVSAEQLADLMQLQTFSFNLSSEYKSIKKNDKQEKAMIAYGQEFNIPIYYLLYNPAIVPMSVQIPVRSNEFVCPAIEVGCRVMPDRVLRDAMINHADDSSPSFNTIRILMPKPFRDQHSGGWRLEHFFVNELCACNQGKRVTGDDRALFAVFNRRTGTNFGRDRDQLRRSSRHGLR
jgi:hypothetical protein